MFNATLPAATSSGASSLPGSAHQPVPGTFSTPPLIRTGSTRTSEGAGQGHLAIGKPNTKRRQVSSREFAIRAIQKRESARQNSHHNTTVASFPNLVERVSGNWCGVKTVGVVDGDTPVSNCTILIHPHCIRFSYDFIPNLMPSIRLEPGKGSVWRPTGSPPNSTMYWDSLDELVEHLSPLVESGTGYVLKPSQQLHDFLQAWLENGDQPLPALLVQYKTPNLPPRFLHPAEKPVAAQAKPD